MALSRLSDELLARHASAGSDRAFTALYERYHQPLYRYCRSIVRNEADAQDALQSTFASALSALQRDGRNAPLRPWLYRIAHNESVSLLRRRKRDQYEEVTEFTALGSSAEEQAAGRARWQRLVDDLTELPERQRGALLLRELAGLSHGDIAVALGLSVGAAKQAIFEARQGLAELEEGRAMSCEEVRRRVSEGDRRILRGRRVRSHLRECAACEAFATAIPARQTELRAFAPALPPAAAGMLLSRVIGAGSSHGALSAGAGAGSAAGSAAAAGGIGKVAGTAAAWKALAGVAVLATATAGVTGLTHVLRGSTTAGHPTPVLGSHSAGGASGAGAGHGGSRGQTVTSAASRHASSVSASQGATAHQPHHSAGQQSPAGASSTMTGAAHPGKALGHGTGQTSHTGHGRAVGHSHSSSGAHAHHGKALGHAKSHAHAYGHTHAAPTHRIELAAPQHTVRSTAGSTGHSGGGAHVQVPSSVDQVVSSGADHVKKTASSVGQ
jgi:RNA polymerase sigma factor (sigma-70 family)